MILAVKAAVATSGGGTSAITGIASTTLSTSATTITFNSIPGTYDDLYLVMYVKGDPTYGVQPRLRINNDSSASNYSSTTMYGDGASRSGYFYPTGTAAYMEIVYGTNSTTTNYTLASVSHFQNYANNTYKKTVLTQVANDKNGSGDTSLTAGQYHQTTTITRLDLICASLQNFQAGSVFALYGIKKAV